MSQPEPELREITMRGSLMLKSGSRSTTVFPNNCYSQLTSRFLGSIPNLPNQNLPKSSLKTCVFKTYAVILCVCKFGKHCRYVVINLGCTSEPPWELSRTLCPGPTSQQWHQSLWRCSLTNYILKRSQGSVKGRESLPQKNSRVRIQIFSVALSARPVPGADVWNGWRH